MDWVENSSDYHLRRNTKCFRIWQEKLTFDAKPTESCNHYLMNIFLLQIYTFSIVIIFNNCVTISRPILLHLFTAYTHALTTMYTNNTDTKQSHLLFNINLLFWLSSIQSSILMRSSLLYSVHNFFTDEIRAYLLIPCGKSVKHLLCVRLTMLLYEQCTLGCVLCSLVSAITPGMQCQQSLWK